MHDEVTRNDTLRRQVCMNESIFFAHRQPRTFGMNPVYYRRSLAFICLSLIVVMLWYLANDHTKSHFLPGTMPSRPSDRLVQRVYAGLSSLPNVVLHESLGFVPHFVAYTFNWYMLNQCLLSFNNSKIGWRNVILIDNSPGKLAVKKQSWLAANYHPMIISIVPTSSLLSFSHLQNLFFTMAEQSGCRVYSWSHMDIFLLPFQEDWNIYQRSRSSISSSPNAYKKYLDSIYHVNTTEQNWGLIFYAYDWLTAVRTEAFKSNGPFDVAIPQYKADCDYYNRLRLKGYQTINRYIMHVFHMSTILSTNLTEEMKTCTWQRANEILNTSVKNSSKGDSRTQWRLDGMRRADREAASILTPAGWTYYERKWGTHDCGTKLKPHWNVDPMIP